jgi:hypothetical protein
MCDLPLLVTRNHGSCLYLLSIHNRWYLHIRYET